MNSINPLLSALSLDPSNAIYHYELGHYYAQVMSESWKESKWRLERGKWIIEFKEKTLDYGLLTLDSYSQAVNLQPTNGYYHLCLGWILDQLSLLNSINSTNSTNLSRLPRSSNVRGEKSERLSHRDPKNSTNEFSLAVMLDPSNKHTIDYVTRWQSKTNTQQ